MANRVKRMDLNFGDGNSILTPSLLSDIFKQLDKDTQILSCQNIADPLCINKTSFRLTNPRYSEIKEGQVVPQVLVIFQRHPDNSVTISSVKEFTEGEETAKSGLLTSDEYPTVDEPVDGIDESIAFSTDEYGVIIDGNKKGAKKCGCGLTASGVGGKHIYYCDLYEKVL